MSRYVAIRSEGGLIPFDTIDKILAEELPGQKPADFNLPKGRRVGDEISRAWSDALDYWRILKRRVEGLDADDLGTTITRRWVAELLSDLVGYEQLTLQRAGSQVGGKLYPISHRAGEGEEAPPVHIVGFRQSLDRRDESGHRRMSPQAVVQEYLNRSEHLWGVVTNGVRLRLLRDTARTARPTYLEFDLQSIFEGGRYNEFAVFYRLCHRTRLPKTVSDAPSCLVEQYYQASIDEGARIRDRLRDGVEEALKILGNGFLRHPANDRLRQRVRISELTAAEYYRQLLRLIYRLLFLMVAEERQLITVAPGPGAERRQRVYDEHYSLRRLRNLAEQPIEESPYGDLWVGLQRTFGMFTNGQENPLGMRPLDGDLFGPTAIPDLEQTGLSNHELLLALRRLSVFREAGAVVRVNYAGLDVEELGSVYESLLDYHPVVGRQNGILTFDLLEGMERKSTGSYYTPRELVGELVDSALVPVLEGRLTRAKTPEEKEQAILELTVCDPASGSGHFLLAAARRMARELAKIRTGEEEPTPDDFRKALRDIIRTCLYAVDLNPLAVDLCKLALWIEGHNPGFPLTFLDHRIKCGNSLVGVSSTEALAVGIPDDAFREVFGDDKATARALRRRNADERKAAGTQVQLLMDQMVRTISDLATAHAELDRLPEITVADIHEKERRYRDIRDEGSSWWVDWTAANLWTAAFFMPLIQANAGFVPTTRDLRAFLEGHGDAAKIDAANRLSQDLRFFHWPLEFPEIFARGGFDVVLGNPPWERIKLQEEEFFAARDRRISEAPRKADRERLIKELPKTNPKLYEEYVEAKHEAEAQSKFVRGCGRYPLTAVGDINTYALFAELGRSLMGPRGRMGMVVPTGIGTDVTYKDFFGDVVEKRELASLFDFENRKALFPGVHRSYKFCLLTLSREPVELAGFAFFLHRAEDLADDRRRFAMPPGDLALFNPNTRTCPIFRTRTDMELTRSIYTRVPVLVNERVDAGNPWGIGFRRIFDMNKSEVLKLCQASAESPGDEWVPMYESKLFHQYDHRWATYEGVPRKAREQGKPRILAVEERRDPTCHVRPRYWIRQTEVRSRLRQHWSEGWILAFRDIARATDERTMIAAILPWAGTDFTVRLAFPTSSPRHIACLLANLNTLVLDYCARQAVGGTHVADFVTKQLPILPPGTYTADDIAFIVPRVAELVYTAHDLAAFAASLGFGDSPFSYHTDHRAALTAELDAYYAHLYGLSRDELRYILDPTDVFGDDFPSESFRVLKEREEEEYGEFRTYRLVLEAYDGIAKTSRLGGRVIAVLPGNPAARHDSQRQH